VHRAGCRGLCFLSDFHPYAWQRRFNNHSGKQGTSEKEAVVTKYNPQCAVLTFVAVILFACDRNTVDPGGTVRTGNDSLIVLIEQDTAAPFTPFIVTATISAVGMNTRSCQMTVSGLSATGLITDIPAGANRVVEIIVYDSAAAIRNRATVTTEVLPDTTITLTILVKKGDGNFIITGTIPGHRLKADEVWSGTLLLKGDIDIPAGLTLTIQPGTKIKVAGIPDWDSGFIKNRIDIFAKGSIIANGTENSIISIGSDSSYPNPSGWWGFGCSGEAASFKYCSIYGAEYGIFIFSSGKAALVCEHCLFSENYEGIVDFGPDNTYSNVTFDHASYGYVRFNRGRTAGLLYCLFSNNSSIDVQSVDSTQTISVESSNFFSSRATNLYIPSSANSTGSKITADNCYGISKVNESGSGTIVQTNVSLTPIQGAGCGFTLPSAGSAPYLGKKTPGSEAEHMRELKTINEKGAWR
jgi:hypothetical protein